MSVKPSVTVSVDLAEIDTQILVDALSSCEDMPQSTRLLVAAVKQLIPDEDLYAAFDIPDPGEVEISSFDSAEIIEYAEDLRLRADYGNSGLIREISKEMHVQSDPRNRHGVLHDLGLVPKLERIEDLIAAGMTEQAQAELSAFIRPEGVSRLGLHKAVA